MKAISLWQPWASLVACRRKRIETRPWGTNYRGPLAIHAAARPPVPGECPGSVTIDGLGEWIYWLPERWTEEDQKAAGCDDHDGDLCGFTLPLGAVVATCRLVDVVPIGGPTSFSTGTFEGERPPTADRDVLVYHPGGLCPEALILDRWDGPTVDVSDQLPFGDFRPGRFGWMLEDVTWQMPTRARGHQGLWNWNAA